MKRNFSLAALLAAVLTFTAPLLAQDSPAAAAAEREEREENYKRAMLTIERLEVTSQKQQAEINKLASEVHSLRDELDRLKSRNENAATQEAIKKLQDAILEVDKKRLADSELTATKLKAIGKELSRPLPSRDPAPPAASRAEPTRPPTTAATPPEKAYAYKIKDGDTLARIVKDLGAQGFKVTQKQVMDTNPGLNWSKLRIGQTVYIPQPAQ